MVINSVYKTLYAQIYSKYELIFQVSAGLLFQFLLPTARDDKKMQCAVLTKCTFISSICKVSDAHEQEAIKNFHRNEKKSHIWYFVQEWISYKKMHFKTLKTPTRPYITAKL